MNPFSSGDNNSLRAAPAAPAAEPIDMVLHCPNCHLQHIDAPEWVRDLHDMEQGQIQTWRNPPHRSHLCHGCGYIWRPADVPTNGVAAVKTKGKADSPLAAPSQPADQNECSLCNGMGFIDGIGTTCPHCVGEGSEPVAQAMGAPEEWAEFQQWRRMKKIFANRPPSPASADFDFPGPNDRDEPVAQAAQQPDPVFLIYYDDQDRKIELFAGLGATAAAQERYRQISGQWNAHLFAKVRSNCRDDPYYSSNVRLPAAEQAAADQREALQWMDVFGCKHTMTTAAATALLKELFDEWPGGLEEIQAARRPVRELTDADKEDAKHAISLLMIGFRGNSAGTLDVARSVVESATEGRALSFLSKATGEGK